MNKKIQTSEIAGTTGVLISKADTSSTLWANGENIEFVKTTTNISIDTYWLNSQIEMYLNGIGRIKIDEYIANFIKDKVRFDMVSWINEDGFPEVTCQLFFGDKLIGEKTTHITVGGTQDVANPT